MTINVFEQATRQKYRYPTAVGDITTEQLWDLPLTSATPKFPNGSDKPDLDKVAKAIAGELRSITEESFVKTSTNPREVVLTSMLEVVKHIIAYKQEEDKAKADRAAKATKRAALLEALDERDRTELTSKTREQLLEELKALS
jgi:hypothetical protein